MKMIGKMASLFLWRCNTVIVQGLTAFFGHPVGCPGRSQHNIHTNSRHTLLVQTLLDVVRDFLHGGATGIGGRDGDDTGALMPLNAAHNAEINNGKHWYL